MTIGRWLTGMVIIASIAGVIWYQQEKNQTRQVETTSSNTTIARAQMVSVTQITRADVPVQIQALGTVTPLQQVVVRSRIDGELMTLDFKEGDWVKKGQLLARIDPRPLQALLAQHQAQAKRDQALLTNAKVDLKRYQQLVQDEAVSSQQIDTQQALVKQYEANLAGSQAQIANTELQLSYCHIHAPIAGRAGFRKIDVGNHVNANDANGLVQIVQLDPIGVVFSLPEQQGLLLYHAMQAKNTAWQVEAWQKDQATPLAEGKILSVDNQLDSATGTLKFKASFANAQQSLLPNQFVQIRLTEKILSHVMTLPKAAVLKREQGNFIYQIQPDDTVITRTVDVIYSTETLSVIAWATEDHSTMNEQLPIVLEGSDKLRTGSRVKYQQKKTVHQSTAEETAK